MQMNNRPQTQAGELSLDRLTTPVRPITNTFEGIIPTTDILILSNISNTRTINEQKWFQMLAVICTATQRLHQALQRRKFILLKNMTH